MKAGTKFGEPAPLFPRAEKEAIERMQNLEDENNRSAVEAAGGQDSEAKRPAASATPAIPPGKSTEQKAPATAARHAAPVAAKATAEPASTPLTAPAQASVPAATQGTRESPAAAPQGPQHITIDDFAKVELRVAQILVAERVPKADKLLRLEIDLGTEKRQILAGIAEHYEPEKLVGRKIVVVANLAPRKMRGLESNGMLLAASLEGGVPVLAGFLEEVPLGARLK